MPYNTDSKALIFISYAREDFKAAKKLFLDFLELQNFGLQPWLDKESLVPGKIWEDEIKNAVENSRYVLPLFSSTSIKKRGYIQKEFKFVLETIKEIPEGEIFVIPVRLDDCDIPYAKFKRYQYVDLFPNWNKGVQKILDTMGIKNKANTPKDGPVNNEHETVWKNLLKSLKERKCIPVIGADSLTQLASSTYTDICAKWAQDYGYPLNDYFDLQQVAQYLAITQGNQSVPKSELADILNKMQPPDFSLPEYDGTPYSVLSDLKLPVYITTNYDHFMEAALISSGRQPVTDFCRWNEYLLNDDAYSDLTGNLHEVSFPFSKTRLSTLSEQGSDYKPSENRPLVYHLYGDSSIPESMVLTEKDFFDFVIGLNKNNKNISLNPLISRLITTMPLLFIGYRLESMPFRMLVRNMLYRNSLSNVLVLPNDASLNGGDKGQKYLNLYIKEMFNANALWSETSDFSADLRQRWNMFRNLQM
jgi:hypothetical protein